MWRTTPYKILNIGLRCLTTIRDVSGKFTGRGKFMEDKCHRRKQNELEFKEHREKHLEYIRKHQKEKKKIKRLAQECCLCKIALEKLKLDQMKKEIQEQVKKEIILRVQVKN